MIDFIVQLPLSDKLWLLWAVPSLVTLGWQIALRRFSEDGLSIMVVLSIGYPVGGMLLIANALGALSPYLLTPVTDLLKLIFKGKHS